MKHSFFILAVPFFFSASLYSQPAQLKPPEGTSKKEFQTAYRQASGLQTLYRSIYENVRPSVVQVIVTGSSSGNQEFDPFRDDPFFRKFFGIPRSPNGRNHNSQPQSLGSGFIIDSKGIIITNKHVIGNASKVKVKLHDGRILEGKVRGFDELTDIAVIKIKNANDLHAARLGNSDELRVGDIAIAVGNPFGLDGTFTTGVVSAVGRTGLDTSGLKFIQTDAAVNQGNSGGPLLNMNGEVVGINRMIVSPSGGSVGIGFSIPINEVRNIIHQIRKNGSVERPLLGIGIEPLTEEISKKQKTKGLLVIRVQSGSGAWKAGIKIHDIIENVDGKEMTDPEELVQYILTKNVGDRVILDIVRKSKKIQI
ncbi:MAG: trypsin-like peptidase domain-containing protein, partial [Spirochaetia bacterium]|nr:trypsin-like peptidase domain-containing protein [Spirochaetia bacterium]